MTGYLKGKENGLNIRSKRSIRANTLCLFVCLFVCLFFGITLPILGSYYDALR